MSPALAGRLLTTAPPGKPWQAYLDKKFLESWDHGHGKYSVDKQSSSSREEPSGLSLHPNLMLVHFHHRVSRHWNNLFVHSCRQLGPTECQALNLAQTVPVKSQLFQTEAAFLPPPDAQGQ